MSDETTTTAVIDDEQAELEYTPADEVPYVALDPSQIMSHLFGGMGSVDRSRYSDKGQYKGDLSDEEFDALPVVNVRNVSQTTAFCHIEVWTQGDVDAHFQQITRLRNANWDPVENASPHAYVLTRETQQYQLDGGEWSEEQPEQLKSDCCGQNPTFQRGEYTQVYVYLTPDEALRDLGDE